MLKKQLRQEKLWKVGRGLLCFFTPHAFHVILNVLYAGTLAGQVLALYLVTALVIVWVLLRPGYLIVAVNLLLQSLFFAFEGYVLPIDPTTGHIEPFACGLGPFLGMTCEETSFYEMGVLWLYQSSAISGALVLIGGVIYNGWKRRMRP